MSYQVTPSFSIAAGPPIQYLNLKLKANPAGGLAPSRRSSKLEGDDIGIDFTAGALWQPTPWTSIGLGFRSAVSHNVEGDASMDGDVLTTAAGTAPFNAIDFSAKLETPDILTFSVSQSLNPNTRPSRNRRVDELEPSRHRRFREPLNGRFRPHTHGAGSEH